MECSSEAKFHTCSTSPTANAPIKSKLSDNPHLHHKVRCWSRSKSYPISSRSATEHSSPRLHPPPRCSVSQHAHAHRVGLRPPRPPLTMPAAIAPALAVLAALLAIAAARPSRNNSAGAPRPPVAGQDLAPAPSPSPSSSPPAFRPTQKRCTAANVTCKSGPCLMSHFGGSGPNDGPSGVCVVLRDDRTVGGCSVRACSLKGSAERCYISEAEGGFLTTCGFWARRSDGKPGPYCGFKCVDRCASSKDRPVDSKGNSYCNICKLMVASCRSGFKVFGPPDPNPRPGTGDACSTAGSRIPAKPCANSFDGDVCVIEDFGRPAADKPNRGTCRYSSLGKTSWTCSVEVCSGIGANGLCTVPWLKYLTTCRAWAMRGDGGVKPDCSFKCIKKCRKDRPIDNNGKAYCNGCALKLASCRSNFRIFRSEPSPKPTPSLIPWGRRCSTQASWSRTPVFLCKSAHACVIDDFGSISQDKPNSGLCRGYITDTDCSLSLCSSLGADFVCKVPHEDFVTTCGVWAKEMKQGCSQACTEECLLKNRPRDSNGKVYCNECNLDVASCKSGFKITGPFGIAADVTPPPPPPKGRCTPFGPARCKNGDVCVVDEFGEASIKQPNVGACANINAKQPTCTVKRCAEIGSTGFCTVPVQRVVTTCGAWAVSNVKRSCNFRCVAACSAPGKPILTDNEGRTHCNMCKLQLVSCKTNFNVHKVPTLGGKVAKGRIGNK